MKAPWLSNPVVRVDSSDPRRPRPPRTRVRAILSLLAVLGVGQASLASHVTAQPRPPRSAVAANENLSAVPRKEADRWIPSLALEGGISFQKWDADVSSQACRDCAFDDPGADPEPLQPGGAGDDRDSTALIGIQLELMSPQLPIPGSPRFFIGGEIAPTFGNERDIVSRGQPGSIGSPSTNENTRFSDAIATGQGSTVTMKRDELTFGLSAGLAFPFELFGRELEIRPSLNWTRFDVELDGFVSDADCKLVTFGNVTSTQCNSPGPPVPAGFLRQTQIRTSTDETFDGIGPGLHVEMKAGRVGPLGTTVFAGARFFRLLGDKDVEIRSAPTTVSDELGTDQTAARFGFEVDDWIYRFGVGIRLQWLGDERPSRR